MTTKDNTAPDAAANEVITGGQTMVDENGQLISSVQKTEVTDDQLRNILGKDTPNELSNPLVSYRTTDDLTTAILNKKPTDEHEHEGEGPEDDRRPFLGVNLTNKVRPADMPQKGKDPLGVRKFIGDEFPRMLLFAPPPMRHGFAVHPATGQRVPAAIPTGEPAQPAFYSHWPAGTELKDMKVLKINIATKLPDYMKKGTVAATMEGMSEFAFKKKSLEESFSPITDKVEKAWRRFAADYEQTYGIKLDVRRDDAPDAHPENEVNMTVAGFSKGHPQLAGFSNFPDSMSRWGAEMLSGHKQGYMMLNHEYCNSPLADEYKIYDLIFHEFGHFMGMVHPHDLGAMKMSQEEALNNTAMAYTDGKFTRFDGQEGAICGPVDYGLRGFMPNPPKINAKDGVVYDLEKEYKRCLGENADSRVMAMTKLMPSIPIVNHGKGATLKGSANGDILDTEPGHVSYRINALGVRQGYALVEGHIEKVIGRAGQNRIFLSSKGRQEVYPGPDGSQIHIYSPTLVDDKIIHSEGKDQLVLHQDIFLNNPDFKVEQKGNDIVFSGSQASIVLKDQLNRKKGVASILVVNDEGRAVMQQDVTRFTIKGFNTDVIDTMQRHIRRFKEAEAEREQNRANGIEEEEEQVNFETHLPDQIDSCDIAGHNHGAGNDNIVAHPRAKKAVQGDKPDAASPLSSHLKRLQQKRAEKEERGAESQER